MDSAKTLFAQVLEFVPWASFARVVARFAGDARVSTLRTAEQFRITDAGETIAAVAEDYELKPEEIEETVLYDRAA